MSEDAAHTAVHIGLFPSYRAAHRVLRLATDGRDPAKRSIRFLYTEAVAELRRRLRRGRICFETTPIIRQHGTKIGDRVAVV